MELRYSNHISGTDGIVITSVVQMRWGYNMWVIHVLIISGTDEVGV